MPAGIPGQPETPPTGHEDPAELSQAVPFDTTEYSLLFPIRSRLTRRRVVQVLTPLLCDVPAVSVCEYDVRNMLVNPGFSGEALTSSAEAVLEEFDTIVPFDHD